MDRLVCEAGKQARARYDAMLRAEEPERRERFRKLLDRMTNPIHDADKALQREAGREREACRAALFSSPDLGGA